ncbi:GtrA family protein [Verrucomicrobiaceae bacterium 227]
MKKLIAQASRFGFIGLAATALHFLLALILIKLGIPPLVANFGAFCGAFVLSYLGHAHWSFRDQDHSRHSSLKRFLIISGMAFLINESLFALLLTRTSLPHESALALTLMTVAGATFLFSKNWAFASAS